MKLLEDNKSQIIADYISGKSIKALAKEYNVSGWSIKNIIIKSGIKLRSLIDLKIKFDESFFFRDSPETYYFWGFMLGDGCLISHKQGHKYITISLKENDVKILEKFCEWLNMDYIHIKRGINNHNTKYVRLELYGSFFKNDFSKFGFVSNKTYNPVIPEIDAKFIRPFIMGLIDADGSVAWNKPRTNNIRPHIKQQFENSIQLIGHPLIMDWVVASIRTLGFNGNINSQIIKGKWKRIRIQRKQDVADLSRILEIDKYYHFCLERKWSNLYNMLSSCCVAN